MIEHFRLSAFEVRVNKTGNTAILVSGSYAYYEILVDTFSYSFSSIWPDQYNRYDWGTFVNGIGEEERNKIRSFLDLLSRSVYINDGSRQTFALSYHWNSV